MRGLYVLLADRTNDTMVLTYLQYLVHKASVPLHTVEPLC